MLRAKVCSILAGVSRFELGYTRWEQVHEVLLAGVPQFRAAVIPFTD
jgi:hypothetical protein